MSLFECCIVLFASCLFAVANDGHIGDSHIIRAAGFSGGQSNQANTNETEQWCSSKYIFKSYSYQWTIDNFSHCPSSNGFLLNTPLFPKSTNEEFSWMILLYPGGKNDQSEDQISLYFRLDPYSKKALDYARYKFSILDEHGNHSFERDSKHPEKYSPRRWFGFDAYISRDQLLDANNGLLPGDNLTILCDLDALIEVQEYSEPVDKPSAPRDQLANHLEQLYESQKFTDLTISVGEELFKAHKAILAARSPVFKAMFSHNMRESQVNRLELIDIDPVVFREVLRYIYTGKSSLLESNGLTLDDSEDHQEAQQQLVVGLLMASDKYQLDGLASICEQVLTRAISLESAGDILLLADTFNRPQLKNKVVQFMRDNHDALIETNDSISAFKEEPTELKEDLYSKA